MFGLKNLPYNSILSSNNVAALNGFSKEGWLCVSSKVTLSKFADPFKIFLGSSNKIPNVTKLTILIISGEKASILRKVVKKIN